jgi:GMP synthase-like glutamine amidotransferase
VEIQETTVAEIPASEVSEPMPFPLQHNFCRYESIEKTIASARVLIVDNLLRDEADLSEIAVKELGKEAGAQLKQERQIATLALQNIVTNIARLVKEPETKVTHVSAVAEAAKDFQPDAIVLSGTLRDFDYYHPKILSDFTDFIQAIRTPVLGICGGHQLIGLSFGARVVTLDKQEQEKRRTNRVTEYQYRFVRIVEPEDPIFSGIDNPESSVWQDYTREGRILRVWQNHGLQLDRVPAWFQVAGPLLSLPQSNDGQALRQSNDLLGPISPRKILRGLVQQSHALGTSKRIKRRPAAVRKLPAART